MAQFKGTVEQLENAAAKTKNIADYIIEQGEYQTTANNGNEVIWHYEKWYSGKAECWCSLVMGSIFGGDMQLWNNSVYSTQIPQGLIPFPPNLFTTAPYETATINKCVVCSVWLCGATNGDETGVTNEHTGSFYLVSPGYYPQGLKVTVAFRDVGYWK